MTAPELTFIAIVDGGVPAQPIAVIPPALREALDMTAEHYKRVGCVPPWTGYVAMERGTCVGVCGFKSPPCDGEIEIAYGTFPDHQGSGVATQMARHLLRIVQGASNPALTATAQTLPQENASTCILRKLGFQLIGPVEHPEDGTVWQWRHGGA